HRRAVWRLQAEWLRPRDERPRPRALHAGEECMGRSESIISRRGLLALPIAFAIKESLAAMANANQQPNLNALPPNLPRPKDDGGARHLKGMAIPDLELPSTSNRQVNLSKIA